MLAAGASAANALNPIPGADIAVDITILLKLFRELRSSFGLTNELLGSKKWIGPLTPIARNVAEYISREGIMFLLKRFAGQVAIKESTKWVPFIGQAIAASVGFGITNSAGHTYLKDCYVLAKATLEGELGLSSDT